MPRITSVRALDDLWVEVVWAAGGRAGRAERVDLSPVIHQYKVYAPIRAAEGFATLQLADDGEVLEWNGGAIDMPATQVEELAEQQMTGPDFVAFLERHSLTRAAAAAEFGMSLRSIQSYVQSDDPLPRVFALACRGYEVDRLRKKRDTARAGKGISCSFAKGGLLDWPRPNYRVIYSAQNQQEAG